MYRPVLPQHRRPVLLQTEPGRRKLTQIAVDRVQAQDGHYHVLYIGTGTYTVKNEWLFRTVLLFWKWKSRMRRSLGEQTRLTRHFGGTNTYKVVRIQTQFLHRIWKKITCNTSVYVTLMSSSIRWLSGVESYHHLQQRHRHHGGGAAGRAANIQGIFSYRKCETEVDFVTRQILHLTAYASQCIIAAAREIVLDSLIANLCPSYHQRDASMIVQPACREILRMIWM